VYFFGNFERCGQSAAKLLSKDEGSRIAVNVAKLPGLLSKPQCSAWKVIDHAFGEMFSGVAI
jgi:hypothetical protein